jgi:hypothetical protein
MHDKNKKITRKMKSSNKMNLVRLAGLVIFVFLFGIASNSLTNTAFAINTSHEKGHILGLADYSKTNINVPKDKSIEEKVKDAKAKLEAEIKHLKGMIKSKGYLEK